MELIPTNAICVVFLNSQLNILNYVVDHSVMRNRHTLPVKGTVSRDGIFFLKVWTNKSVPVHWSFSRSRKSFSIPYPIKLLTFYLLLWNYFIILKMRTSSEFLFLWLVGPFLVPTFHWLQGKCARLVTGGLRYDFTESQAAACKHFQSQSRRFRVLEAGYWKDFQN